MESKENIEIALLLQGVYEYRGHDFRNYAFMSLKRRLQHRLNLSGLQNFSEMIPLLLHDDEYFKQFLTDMSVTVTEMYRDPDYFKSFRENVVPYLRTYPSIKIWVAGCATGEEAYSYATLLQEEGLLDKSHIYATDINRHSLKIGQEGIYPESVILDAEKSYKASGGHGCLEDHCTTMYNQVQFNRSLRKHITFSHHNLACDAVFGEMNVIACRNVVIYFNDVLQSKVFDLFTESLISLGFLCIGTKENLVKAKCYEQYEVVDLDSRIYQKKRRDSHAAV